MLNPPSNLLTPHKEQQNRRTQTGQLTLKKRSEKSLQSAHPQFFLRNFSLSLTRLLYFLSPHSSPFCQSPSTVRERLSRAVTAGAPVGGIPATRPHAFPSTTNPGQRGGSRPPSQVPSPPGKGRPFSPDQFSPVTCKARLSTWSSRKIGRRKAVTFGPRFAVAVQSGLLGQPYLHMSPKSGD